jgi:phospholipid/cholesterol/gamma-HCH transport system ATP-binding protein
LRLANWATVRRVAAEDDAAHVEIRSARVAFGRREVFRDLSCVFPRAQVSVLMGGSGCGKSTLLRAIGGLQRLDSGAVLVAGNDIAASSRALQLARRRLGMLFQNGALLDSMTIFENVALPLREHGHVEESEVADTVHTRLAEVGLTGIDDLLPGELSGGMLRRAALARAIATNPRILLCDEPFSGLDPPNVDRIESLLLQLNRERGLTLVVTSHHVASSLRLADQIVLLQDGAAVCGSPADLAGSGDPRIVEFLGADGAALAERLSAERSSAPPSTPPGVDA